MVALLTRNDLIDSENGTVMLLFYLFRHDRVAFLDCLLDFSSESKAETCVSP